MKKIAVAVASLALVPVLLTAGAKDVGTGETLQNVEVMDPNMRLADARRYMIEFNDALGVQCRDCHDLRDFASDEVPLKLVARDMMKMQKEINANWFPDVEGEAVKCFTCHQGQRIPRAGTPQSSLLSRPDTE